MPKKVQIIPLPNKRANNNVILWQSVKNRRSGLTGARAAHRCERQGRGSATDMIEGERG